MANPVVNGLGSTGNGTSVAANGAFFTLLPQRGPYDAAGVPVALPIAGLNSVTTLSVVSYFFVGGSTGVGTVLTWQELLANGTWASWPAAGGPAPAITLANSTNYAGTFTGVFLGLQILVSSLTGNGFSGIIKATVRDHNS